MNIWSGGAVRKMVAMARMQLQLASRGAKLVLDLVLVGDVEKDPLLRDGVALARP